jgi:hypothetical protein
MRLSLVAAAYAAAMSTAVPAHAGGEGQVRADRSRSPRSSPGVVNLNLATESRRLGRHLASLPYSQKNGSHPFRSRGGKVRTRLLGKGRVAQRGLPS